MRNAFFCVDIGGTKTACAIWSEAGEELFYHSFPTEAHRGAEDLVERVYRCVYEQLGAYRIIGGGLASPGPLDLSRGTVVHAVTLGWKDTPIVRLFEARFGFAFTLLNDCDAGALGVANLPPFRSYSSLCYISLSTGIGGGFVYRGEVYTGGGNAANFGHMPARGEGLVCGCGKRDCLELYASGSGLEQRYRLQTGNSLSCAEIEGLAKAGDETAFRLFEEAAEHLSVAVASIRAILDPQIIVFGGSVCRCGELILGRLGKDVPIGYAPDDGKQVLLGAFCAAKASQKREKA